MMTRNIRFDIAGRILITVVSAIFYCLSVYGIMSVVLLDGDTSANAKFAGILAGLTLSIFTTGIFVIALFVLIEFIRSLFNWIKTGTWVWLDE